MRTVLVTIVIAALTLCCANAKATVRQIECREWIDKQYQGLYEFSFDDLTKHFVINLKPENPARNGLVGAQVNEWTVLFESMQRLVIFGVVRNDWAFPVRVISLDFSRPRMFAYEMGGPVEGDKVISDIQRDCVRID